jgi:hypothetical protein
MDGVFIEPAMIKKEIDDMNTCKKASLSRATRYRNIIGYMIILIVLSFVHIAWAEEGSECPFKGTISGDLSGQVMEMSVTGSFTITISPDGTVSGEYTGDAYGTISGKVTGSGEFNAKGTAEIATWTGKISISDGRLSAKGSWKAFNGEGKWWSR